MNKFIFLIVTLPQLFVFNAKGQNLKRISNFGNNPGNLRMYTYVPEHLKDDSAAPLVVVLHGCLQNAKIVSRQTDWNKLADRYGFRVLYPQQRVWNNPEKCFCWYNKNDIEKDKGEVYSILQMIDYTKQNYTVDTSKVFVTGLSAGAAMSVSLMAVYPEVFNAGAIFAGGPYKAATNIWTGMMAMYGWRVKKPEAWGKYVREQNPNYNGAYPKMIVYHGKMDIVVNRRNATEIVKQWANLHSISEKPTEIIPRFSGNKNIERRAHKDSNGNEAVIYYRIKGVGHALPVDPGKCESKGGRMKPFSADKNFFSTYWAAVDFGLIAPATILGERKVKKFQKAVSFSVSANNGSSYIWAVNKGCRIVSGQGTNSVVVDWSDENGFVNVTEIQGRKCRKPYSTLSVEVIK